MWIGLLWYFNFIQIPNMSKIPDEQKPAIGKVIAPAALFYFRWAAALTIVGYSMNDTVVIYDRIRENLNKYNRLNISEIADLSINDTLARTIITSATTLLALLSIFILGGEILKGFSFAMILGVVIGTYSSIFVASPILKFFKVTYKTLEKEEEKIVP